MRIVIQRVLRASVTIDNQMVSSIDKGLMILVGVREGDTEPDMQWLAAKAANMRIFDDENGVMNRSVMDVDGEILAVSQFTLNASTKKGNRPRISTPPGTNWLCRSTTGFVPNCRKSPVKPCKKACLVPI